LPLNADAVTAKKATQQHSMQTFSQRVSRS
jgi:hypothetical protein